MIDAIWVLIHLMQKQVTKLGDFYIARYPAQVDCISNKHQYEIACINQDNTFVITQLLSPQRQTTNKKVEDEPTRFIFVCRDKKSVVEGVKRFQNSLETEEVLRLHLLAIRLAPLTLS